MTKGSFIEKTESEGKTTGEMWDLLKYHYAMNMTILQKELKLSYRQARALLLNRTENAAMMADELGIDIHAVYNAKRVAEKKLKESGKTYEEIVGEYAIPSMIICGGPYE